MISPTNLVCPDGGTPTGGQYTTGNMGNVGEQVTLEKTLSLNSLPPGTYQITIKVDDKISKQTVSPTAKFAVE